MDKTTKNTAAKNETKFTHLSMLLPFAFIVIFIYSSLFHRVISHDLRFHSQCTDPHIMKLCSDSIKLFENLADSVNCFYDIENHVLGTTYYSKNTYSRQPYIANGYIGARISTLGQGFSFDEINPHSNNVNDEVLQNGWPLYNKRYTGSFISGFYSLQEKLPQTNFPELYDDGYDSIISSIPYWPNLDILLTKDDKEYRFNPQFISDQDISNYHQNLSIANGVVSTKLTWLNEIEIIIDVYAHRVSTGLGLMDIKLTSLSKDLNITLENSLNFTTSQRTELVDFGYNKKGIYMIVSPENVPYSSAAIVSKLVNLKQKSQYAIIDQTVIEKVNLTLFKNRQLFFNKYTSIHSSEKSKTNEIDVDPIQESKIQLRLARSNLELTLKATNLKILSLSHKKSWSEYFKYTDIEIPSDELLTLTARSSLYHILANTDLNSRNLTSALSTTGLSSDSYGGMVFWDTDFWITPAILPFQRSIAKSIGDYRVYTHDQAKLNAKKYGFSGAAYPWTSGRFGNCTSTGPCIDYEYHVNIDVALSSFAVYLAGENDHYLNSITWPLLKDASDFLSEFTTFDPDLNKFITKNLTDPDEFANHIDNGAFTNSGIDTLLKLTILVAHHLNKPINPKWVDVKDNIHIPKSETGITLEYSGMNSSVLIKQADVILLTFPLNYIIDENLSRNDLFYYSLKQADIGPAMTFPIFTIASSKLLNYGCSSQSYLKKSIIPYIRSPFAQFSEQADDNILTNGGTHPAFPFLTAHGGYLQAIVYGVLGLNYSFRINSETSKIERFLKFDPVKLLSFPGGIQVKGIDYMGQRLDVTINDDEGIIKNNGYKPVKIEVQPRNPKNGNYTIKANTELIIPVFNPYENIKDSVTECKLIANLTAGSPGEVALSSIDGNNYTYWQPLTREPGRLLIDLNEKKNLSKGLIIWGSRPAKFLNIFTYNHDFEIYEEKFESILLDFDINKFDKVVDNLSISISEPFSFDHLAEVKLLPNNETYFELENEAYTRYVLVEIVDAIDDNGSQGATLNEFVLF